MAHIVTLYLNVCCTDTTLLQYHLPFKYDDKRISKDGLSTLVQNGYIIRYSKRRQTPAFTAQKLDGKLLKQMIAKVYIIIIFMLQHTDYCNTGMLHELINVLIFVCIQGRLDRSKNTYFRSDPRLSLEDTSTCNGYKGSGYDRGHNAPSGNKQRITLQTNIHTHIHIYTCTVIHTYS